MLVPLMGLLASCQDVVPYPSRNPSDSLSVREYPHAFFIVEGTIIDSLSQEPIPNYPIKLHSEQPVATNEQGIFRAQTIAFPISQEFRLILNPLGEGHLPMYPTQTHYVSFFLPTFQLTKEDVIQHGPKFFGRTFMTLAYTILPNLVQEDE